MHYEIFVSNFNLPSLQDFQLLVSGGTTDVDINRLRSVISFSNSNGCSTDILDRFKR